MALFQVSVLKTYLAQLDATAVASAYKRYSRYFHDATIQNNIRSGKEEEYQGLFLTELFVAVLGYTLKPKADFNLVAEYKNQTNARKADGAILHNDIAIGVIELKGTNTKDLESIRKQAFDYKANQKGCVYVITSNFEKLRFYINDATEFLEFNLFELAPEEFALLYLCLHKDHVINHLPLTIKEASLVEEENITKQFYNDYSVFKRELFRDLVKRNDKRLKQNAAPAGEATLGQATDEQKALEKNVKLSLFKKSQKLIDRFLFIFFAEDRELLPPNSTIQILDKWKADIDFGDERPLYNLFKQYFHFLDEGRKGTSSRAEIYAYNGGLFKPDPILDGLEIDDALLYKHTYALANYDFSSQVDVNILGHIFENSLNEIESVNAEIEGGAFDKQKSKRKKDGVFYTPKYITKYIVEHTVGKLCQEKKEALGFKEEAYFELKKGTQKKTKKALLDTLDSYRAWLLQLTICDPACGSGAFLNQALDFLIKEHRYIDELKAKVVGGSFILSDIENTILERNIYGVDLNEESVEIAKLSLWLRTAQPRRKLNDLSHTIKCGNSLIDSKAVAGNKAFDWEAEFPQVFKARDKKAYHITTAVHDSRTSARMERYKVRERRNQGANPDADVVYFTPEEDALITETISGIVKADDLKVLAYNICADHIHLLLVCGIEDIPGIMQKLKSVSSKVVNRARAGASEGFTREHAPLQHNGKGSAHKIERDHKPLWQQKYSAPKEVTTEAQLDNTIRYIQGNRAKHGLPEHPKAVADTIASMCCSVSTAFDTDYKGGFDVVIGNPPYLNMTINNTNKSWLNYYMNHYKSIKNANSKNLYTLFNELSCNLVKKEGLISFIIPEGFLRTRSYNDCVLQMEKQGVIYKAIYFEDWVFDDATTGSMIFEFVKSLDHDNIFKEYIINKDKEVNEIIIKKNPVLEKYQTLNYKTIDDYCDLFKGMAVRNRKEYISETYANQPNAFLLGNCINRYLITNSFYCDYDELTIVGGTKNLEKHNIEPRILIRRTGDHLCCVMLEDKALTESTLYSCSTKDDSIDLGFLLALLNSKMLTYIVRQNMITNEQAFPQIMMTDIKLLKVPSPNNKVQKKLRDLSDYVSKQHLLNYDNNAKFVRYIIMTKELKKLSRKLENWHELEFSDFIKELNKALAKENRERRKANEAELPKLTKTDEFEWLELFEANKAKAQVLQQEIDQTEREIDQMVYALYGLTDEEITIVEGS